MICDETGLPDSAMEKHPSIYYAARHETAPILKRGIHEFL